MKIHEYQAKDILARYGVAVPRGEMVTARDEAERVAKELMDLGAKGVVVKAQIHAGGRGTGIEEVAARDLNAILKEHVEPGIGLLPFQARRLAFGLGLKHEEIAGAVKLMTALYRAYEETDASLAEINPFITTTDGRLFAL